MTETPILEVPAEAIAECLGTFYVWFEGEAVATAPVSAE